MKLETLNEGIRIANNIRFLENQLDKLNKSKIDLESKGGIKLEMGWDEIKIPFDVFKNWFEDEHFRIGHEIDALQKEFDELV